MKTILIILSLVTLLCIYSCHLPIAKAEPKTYSQFQVDSVIAATRAIPRFPFDTILSNCMDSAGQGGTTSGELRCYAAGITGLDTLIAIKCKTIYRKLDKGDKKRLKKSQHDWQQYVQAEEDFLYSTFDVRKYAHGHEVITDKLAWHYGIIRDRLVYLTLYNEMINPSPTD